ncbi:MAG: L,D-transpeptidase family protein [Hyphomicrobiaceae bacterium]
MRFPTQFPPRYQATSVDRRRRVLTAGILGLVLGVSAGLPSAQAQWSGNSESWGNLWPGFNTRKSSKATDRQKRELRRKADTRLDDALQSDQVLLSEETAYALSRAINRYQRIASRGGWPKIPKIKGRWLREGVGDERVTLLRKRLVMSGDMKRKQSGKPWLFDKHVTAGLKKFQIRHGIRPKGVVDNRTLRALNVSAQVRLGQLRLNLTRLRDLLDHVAKNREDGSNRYILVNAPAFELQAVRDNRLEIASKVIVGKPSTQTPAIHASIKGLNFYPFWRVPESIANRDLIPTIIKKPEYLREEGIRVLNDWGGTEIDPATVDWRTARGQGLKFRQDPGERNALGLVRINMPNSEIVYMHDTPLKKLFNSSARAFSSGCVRVHKIRDVVKWLAGEEPEWDPRRVEDALAAGVAEDVKFEKSVPVTFAYITAWGSGAGTAHFRADIYGRDGVQVLLAASEPLPDNSFRLSP